MRTQAVERFVLGSLDELVVLVEVATEYEILVILRFDRAKTLIEEIELELAGHLRLESERPAAFDLLLEQRARRDRNLLAGRFVDRVAEDERGAFEPGDATRGVPIGPGKVVAVARFPGHQLVAFGGFELDVGAEQIGAKVRAVLLGMFEEIPTADSLAEQPTLHIAARDDDGVDRAALDLGRELLRRQHSPNLHRS